MFDIGYLARIFLLFWKYKGKKKSKDIFCETIIKGRCWLNDLDYNWHMNNSRYLRECDFGRTSLLLETGLWDALLQRRKNQMKDANILASASQMQYRQSVELGDTFEIRTHIVGWDDRAFYFEQKMVLDKNQQIAFVLFVRIAVTPRSLTPQMLIDDLEIGSIQSPTLSHEIQIFKDNHRLTYHDIKSKL